MIHFDITRARIAATEIDLIESESDFLSSRGLKEVEFCLKWLFLNTIILQTQNIPGFGSPLSNFCSVFVAIRSFPQWAEFNFSFIQIF